MWFWFAHTLILCELGLRKTRWGDTLAPVPQKATVVGPQSNSVIGSRDHTHSLKVVLVSRVYSRSSSHLASRRRLTMIAQPAAWRTARRDALRPSQKRMDTTAL